MMYMPLNYHQINIVDGTVSPSTVKVRNNRSFWFWERALFERALSAIIIDLPRLWHGDVRDFFNYVFFRAGYLPVFDLAPYGVTFNYGTLSGVNWYYNPTHCIITHPALTKSLDLTIGEGCEILKLTPDYAGIMDIVDYYAGQMSLLDNAINISLVNNKYAFMLAAKNKGAAIALQKMLDKINQGDPAVIIDQRVLNDPNDKSEPWQFWERGNLKSSYMTTDQLADLRTLLHNFDTEIGIPTLPIEKKERMLDREVNSGNIDAASRASIWVRCINESAERVNEHYGLSIKARLAHEPEEVVDDGKSNSDRDV